MEACERGDAVVVRVDPEDCAALWKTVEPWLMAGKHQIVLDFADVSFINSVNIAHIVAVRQRSRA
ncbi:MAG: STAS domain-containing protein, partial [Planctomycetes bacterium]|nr:STAS domain-containing protein [Planctomycetota bacterium]